MLVTGLEKQPLPHLPLIQLIPFEASHFDFLVGWSPTAAFLRQWAGPLFSYPLTQAQLYAHLQAASESPPRAYLFGARGEGDGRLIGHGELIEVNTRSRSAKLARILVGPPDLRGKGYGTAIVNELVRFGFEDLGLCRLTLNVFAYNRSAIRCYEQVGFRHEGSDACRHATGRWNVCRMSLLQHDWNRELSPHRQNPKNRPGRNP